MKRLIYSIAALVRVIAPVEAATTVDPEAPRNVIKKLAESLVVFAAAGVLLLPTTMFATQFEGGPSVRVTPNVSVEFKWITNRAWFGEVWIFDNPDGIGNPITVKRDEDASGNPVASTQHAVTFNITPPLVANTGYFFCVTASDPTGTLPPFSTPTPLPPVFTGVQSLSSVRTESITFSGATITWDANVIGFGSVIYGTTTANQGPVEDRNNIPNHAIVLTGLSPGTTYTFEASNKHAIDSDKLATASLQFTTPAEFAEVVLTQPDASPRTIDLNEVSAVSVVAKNRGTPVPNIVVTFSIDPGSQGSGTFGGASTTQATTDANGRAMAQLTATARGNVFVDASSFSARTSPKIAVVVRRN